MMWNYDNQYDLDPHTYKFLLSELIVIRHLLSVAQRKQADLVEDLKYNKYYMGVLSLLFSLTLAEPGLHWGLIGEKHKLQSGPIPVAFQFSTYLHTMLQL